MRQGTIFTCERCGARGLAGGGCIDCGGRTRDENGFEALGRMTSSPARRPGLALLLLLAVFVLLHRFGNAHLELPRFVFRGLLATIGLVVTLPEVIRDWRARRRNMPITPIVELDPHATFRARVRGRVRLLEGVSAPDGSPLAAREARAVEGAVPPWKSELARFASGVLFRLTFGAYGSPLSAAFREERTEVDRAGGRYLIEDGTGVALVDEDAFELSARPGWLGRMRRWLLPPGRTVVELRDGDFVEVEGLATIRHGAREVDFGLLSEASYRELGPSLLVFDGVPWDPIGVTLVARSASPPRPLRHSERSLSRA